jgi:long-subunit acyl-CoA synthetase (AMP-forming)
MMILDHVYAHEEHLASRVYLTQPVGGGRVIDYTWQQVMHEARCMAAHLRSRGFEPGARIALLSKNCAHFIIAELAIWMAGGTTVAIFPTETAATIAYVLEHSGAQLLFVGKVDLWDRQQAGVPAQLPRIALPLAPPTDAERWDDLVTRTPPLAQRVRRADDEVAMLIYTSGSTGRPKGVMSSFGAIARVGEAIAQDLRNRVGQEVDSRALSYLPLAHSYERSWIEASSMVDGRTHVFFPESPDTFLADLQRARPTYFLSVPRLWLKFQHGVFAKMPPEKLERLLRLPVIGRLVARKVRRGLGLDHVVVAGSGSAPIPPDLIAWYRRIGLRLEEGYGMTEDNSYSHASNASAGAPGCVGVALPGVQVRIADDGEILIKSPGQFSGYYKDPELTAQCFTSDGYFRTGDLGERGTEGLLRITGRAKELFKTSKGKYIAPAPIENRLNADPMIELSMVSGAGEPQPYALLVLAEDVRARLADPAERARIERHLEQLLARVNGELADYEQLQMLVVAPEPWTIENGCLTPTMKIKRRGIESAVQARVIPWYGTRRPVVWG